MRKKRSSFAYILIISLALVFLIKYKTQQKLDTIAYNYLMSFKNYLEPLNKEQDFLWIYSQFLGSPTQIIFPNNNIQDLYNFLSALGIPSLDVRNNGKEIYYRNHLIALLESKTKKYHIRSLDTISIFLNKGYNLYQRQLIDPNIYHMLKYERYQPYFEYQEYKNQNIDRFVFVQNRVIGIEDVDLREPTLSLEKSLNQLVKTHTAGKKPIFQIINMKDHPLFHQGAIYTSSFGQSFVVLSHRLSLFNSVKMNRWLFVILTILGALVHLSYKKFQNSKRKNGNDHPQKEINKDDSYKNTQEIDKGHRTDNDRKDAFNIASSDTEKQDKKIDEKKESTLSDIIKHLEKESEILNNIGAAPVKGEDYSLQYRAFQMKKEKEVEPYDIHFYLIKSHTLLFDNEPVSFFYSLKINAQSKRELKEYGEKLIKLLKTQIETYKEPKNPEFFDIYQSYEGFFYLFNKEWDHFLAQENIASQQIDGGFFIIKKDSLLYRFLGDKETQLLSVSQGKVGLVEVSKNISPELKEEILHYQQMLKSLHPFFENSFEIRTKKLKQPEDLYLILEDKNSQVNYKIIEIMNKNQFYYKSIVLDLELLYQNEKDSTGFPLLQLHYHRKKDQLNDTSPILQKKQLGYIEAYNELFRKELYDKAIELLQEALKIQSTEQLYLDLANAYFLIKDYQKVLEVAINAQKEYPSNDILLYYQTIAWYRTKNVKKAIQCSLKLFIIDPYNKKNVKNLIQLIKILA